MNVPIDINDLDILERYEDYAKYEGAKHREWGRMSWLYPGDIVVQIGGASAKQILFALAMQRGGHEKET